MINQPGDGDKYNQDLDKKTYGNSDDDIGDSIKQESDTERRVRRINYIKKVRHRQRVYRFLILGITVVALGIAMGSCAIKNAIAKKSAEQAAEEQTKEKSGKEQIQDKERQLKQEIAELKQEAEKKGYPQSIIRLLDKNNETLEFVKGYEKNKDKKPAATTGDAPKAGEIPLLMQWDERWGYASYGTSTIASSGCGPTCMSMVIVGLTGNTTATPYILSKYSENNGYLDEYNNTYWAFMNETAANWGISCVEISPDETIAAEALQAGHPIICSVEPGDFTDIGHFIVLTGYEDGKVTVNDPFSKANSKKTWVYADIAEQIREMWIYSAEE